MNATLAALAARRAGLLALALTLALAAWTLVRGLPDVPGASPSVLRGLALEGAWTAFLIVVAPLCALRSAALLRRREREWIGTSRERPILVRASLCAGALAAALVCAALFASALTAILGGEDRIPVRSGSAGSPPAALWSADAPLRWTASDVPGGLLARVDVSLELAPGGGGEVVLRARRDGVEREGRAHVLPRGAVEVRTPGGDGPLELELELPEPGSRGIVLSRATSLWDDSEASVAGFDVARRILCALAAWVALAFGLGAWVRAPAAVLALLALWIPAWWSDAPPAWLPGADLPGALATVAAGRAPGELPLLSPAVVAACIVLGLALSSRRSEEIP